MSNKQIKLQSILVLSEITNRFKEVSNEFKIPAVLGIKLGLLNREIVLIVEEFNKSRNDLIIKFGEEAEQDGQKVTKVKDDNAEEFSKEMITLINSEFTITHLIDIKYFESIDLPLFYSDALVDFIKE